MYTEFARIFVLLSSVLLSVGLWTQVIKMYRTKSTDDFAAITVVSWLIAEIAWLNYGITIKEWPVTVLGLINIPASAAAVIGYFRFRTISSPTTK